MSTLARRSLGITLVALLATACTADEAPPTSSSPTPTTSPERPGPPTDATIYYLAASDGSLFLTPETHEIAGDDARARLEEMLRGAPNDPDHTSPWPAGAAVIDVTLQSGTATINWNAATLANEVGAEAEQLAIQQAVWTVTEIAGIDRVEFLVEGNSSGEIDGRAIEDWWGHGGLSAQPFTRMDDVLAPITITSPDEGAEVSVAVTARGEATVHEANVTLRLLGPDGELLQRTFATASRGAPERGIWSKRLTLPDEPGTYTIEAVEISEEDGSDRFVTTRAIIVT